MFITLTINTNKKRKSPVKMKKRKINPAKGWRQTIHSKKRSFWQRFKAWRRSMRGKSYRLGEQTVIF